MSKLQWEMADTEGVWIGEATEPGPTVGVIGGVHGDETAGPVVIDAVQSNLSLDCGTLVLMLGNIPAIRAKERYVGVNLNRSFRELTAEEQTQDPQDLPYEVRRAQELLPYLDECVAVLDLHEHQYRGSGPFIICEPNAFDTARTIGAPVISSGWASTEPGGTDGYMYAQGREGICYELGCKYEPQPNIERGKVVVARFLGAKGLNEVQLPPYLSAPDFVVAQETIVRRGSTYSLAREFRSFEHLSEGELIAIDGDKRIYASEGDVIIFPDPSPEIEEEAFTIGTLEPSL